MREFGFDRFGVAGALGLLLLMPLGAGAQLRTVVSNEIAVSGTEATLHLDFLADGELTIAFQDGQILMDGEAIGSYVRGNPLDSAWRSLLGQVIALDNGPLAQALVDWEPPDGLPGSAAEMAAVLDQGLEAALALSPAESGAPTGGQTTALDLGEGTLLGALLQRTGALEQLAEGLHGLSLTRAGIRVGEDVVVEAGDELGGTLIIVDGSLRIFGTVDGDVVLAQGSVLLEEGGRITGDLRVADGTVEWLGGSLDGSLIELGTKGADTPESPDLDKLRAELEQDIRRELRSREARESSRDRGPSGFSPLRNLGRAFAGLMENLATFFVLAVLGILAIHFGRENLEIVATTARRAPARSALVGLAGGFLLIPVWFLGMVALAISIIGIPVLLVWVPLFPIAAALAGLLGYLAVARNVGEWVADQNYRGLEWIRGSNSVYAMIAGVGALMVPCVAANLVGILGLGFLKGLLAFIGSAVTFVAGAIGLGAVLLTRGGRIRPYAAYYEFEEGVWGEEPYPEPPADAEPEPTGASPDEGDAPEETDPGATDQEGHPSESGGSDTGDHEPDSPSLEEEEKDG